MGLHAHAKWLGIAGLTPFWFLPAAVFAGLLPADQVSLPFLIYSGLILSFLGGVHWAQGVINGHNPGQTYVAMLPTIWAWLSLLLLPYHWALISLGFGLVAVLLYDLKTLEPPQGYWALRFTLTGVALIGHLAMLLL
ncbi:DUF3429 domain-containing protein [Ferrimonas marina]|uniref:DUF3429 domain-containing protein n=1 Tax=Ferrimonas marina TaxID=299255 RepID=A0A1M5XQ89_9GAMM|nr:DUF3429 domain-containing protein [Ferrimonas marina]SHI01926.1 Protein of unknown function [Ferrimonas marina]